MQPLFKNFVANAFWVMNDETFYAAALGHTVQFSQTERKRGGPTAWRYYAGSLPAGHTGVAEWIGNFMNEIISAAVAAAPWQPSVAARRNRKAAAIKIWRTNLIVFPYLPYKSQWTLWREIWMKELGERGCVSFRFTSHSSSISRNKKLLDFFWWSKRLVTIKSHQTSTRAWLFLVWDYCHQLSAPLHVLNSDKKSTRKSVRSDMSSICKQETKSSNQHTRFGFPEAANRFPCFPEIRQIPRRRRKVRHRNNLPNLYIILTAPHTPHGSFLSLRRRRRNKDAERSVGRKSACARTCKVIHKQ